MKENANYFQEQMMEEYDYMLDVKVDCKQL